MPAAAPDAISPWVIAWLAEHERTGAKLWITSTKIGACEIYAIIQKIYFSVSNLKRPKILFIDFSSGSFYLLVLKGAHNESRRNDE